MWPFKRKTIPCPEAEETLAIINKLLDKKGVVREITPISDEYSFFDEENEFYLVVCHNEIWISNHKCDTVISLGLKFTDKVKGIIRERLEADRLQRKNAIFKNKLALLKRIKESI